MGYEDFNLFSNLTWFTETSGKEWFMHLATLGYNIFYIMAIMALGFKMLQAGYIWLTRADAAFGHTKQQMFMEIFEPVKGLAFFVIGMTVIKIISGFFISI
ncbi:MAG: hypothetical protein Q4B60_05325 [Erysipelotrichaceae bacterium]|nr:hypothetical protein [Erysipelotrichaceae bacterium]